MEIWWVIQGFRNLRSAGCWSNTNAIYAIYAISAISAIWISAISAISAMDSSGDPDVFDEQAVTVRMGCGVE